MSDNFHQSVSGGTGANHIMLGHSVAPIVNYLQSLAHPNQPELQKESLLLTE